MAKQLSVDCEKFNIQGAVFFCERGHTYGMPSEQVAQTPKMRCDAVDRIFCDAISVDVKENWLLS